MLEELSLSDQAAVARACEGFVPRSYADLLALLVPPAEKADPLPGSVSAVAGGSIPFHNMEPAA